MEIDFGIGVLRKPIEYSVNLVEKQGSWTQIHGNSDGSYTPDRTVPSNYLIVAPEVVITNPNKAQGSQVSKGVVTSVKWYYQTRQMEKGRTAISASDARFAINNDDNTLSVRFNMPDSDTGSMIVADITFTNPVTNSSITITRSHALTTSVNTVNSLSLVPEPGNVSGAIYVGDNYVLNPITTPLSTDGNNWKRHLRCQLYDGKTALKKAYDGSNRNGNAFYFWYLKDRKGNLSRITRNTDWFSGTVHPDGTWDNDVIVDLSKMYNATVVCRAGYIPYGEMSSYKDADGTISPGKCLFGFLEYTFRLSVASVIITKSEVVAIANRQVELAEFDKKNDLSTVPIVRRLEITAGGTVLNYTTNPLNDGRNLADVLFVVNWYKVEDNGTRTLIQAGSETLATNLKALGATSPETLPKMVCTVEPRIPDLWGNNCVDGYLPEQEGVATEYLHGNTDWLNDRSFFLIDTTDNKGETTQALRLQKNNLFHFAGGDYAPVVGIKQSQYDECMANDLYSDAAGKTKVYGKGSYDAVNEWNIDKPLLQSGKSARTLYKKASDGTVSAVVWKLRPWETTETKYTIGYGFPYAVYVLDNIKGESGMVWKGLFTDVTEWDGINLTAYKVDASHTLNCKLEPTALSPTAFTTVGGSPRCFFYAYGGDDANNKGEAGNGGFINVFSGGRTYPRTGDVQQVTSMRWCRALNADKTKAYPFAEGGWFALDVLILSLEIQAHTRDISDEDNGFGIGICNDKSVTADTFQHYGGIKYQIGGAVKYGKWNEIISFTVGGKSVTTNWSQLTNYERPKEACMESQMAASYAVELGINPVVMYSFYGNNYYYENIPNGKFPNILDSGMCCRLFRQVPFSFTDDSKGKVSGEFRLRMSLFDGLTLNGDIFMYCGGGKEVVALHTGTTQNGEGGYDVAEYFEPDVRKWHSEMAEKKMSTEAWSFETSYLKIGKSTTGDRWKRQRIPFGILPTSATGASWRKNEVSYFSSGNRFSSVDKQKTRLSLRFGGYALWNVSAPRLVRCNHGLLYAFRDHGGRAQALIATQSQ